jgi:drug/metabolite transporter (DMT)-like permease
MNRIVGAALLVAGVILVVFAYQGSQSIADQTKHAFTGEFRDRTVWMLIGGATAAVAGLALVLIPGRRLGPT